MKVVKPLRLSLIHRVFDHRKKHIMVTTVAYAFPFSTPRAPVTETEMWKMAATELGRFGVLDFWMYKPQGEALVTGACYTGEREKGSEFVRFVVAPGSKADAKDGKDVALREEKRLVDKKLYVFGDRKWTLIGPTEPQMFTRMPVNYAHAFGGEKFDKNPLGKGYAAQKDESGVETHPLPNVEDPKHLIKSKGDRPPPASFTSWDLTWPVHFEKKMGSYDAKWVEKNGFALADDIDFSLFNVAAADQRVPEFFDGDEELKVENMHPDKRMLETRLPGFSGRCLLKFKPEHDRGRGLVDVPLRIDTIHVFPHHERVIVFARGTTEIDTSDASDVELMLGALEDSGEKKPLAHYENVIALRSDKAKGALYALRDKDLMPGSAEVSNTGGIKLGDPLEEAIVREGHLEDNQYQRVLREHQANKERLLAQGIEPDKIPPPPPPPRKAKDVDLEELPGVLDAVERERVDAQVRLAAHRAEQEALLESICKEHDIDLEALKKKAKSETVGPPRFSAAGELARLTEVAVSAEQEGADVSELRAQLEDPNFRAKLLNAEQQFREKYRLTAHTQDAAPMRDAEESAALREELVEALRGSRGADGQGASVTRGRKDFTGADLSGIDLGAVDLEGAFLEGVSLKGANLRGAKLKDAVLSRANLEGAILANADLERANLGRANLRGADLSGARLPDAILYEADLGKANLRGADLTRANTFELRCAEADFSGAVAKNLFFYKVDLQKALFRGARFHLCVFIECDATGIDAQSSDFSQSVFLMSKGDGANFKDSTVENFRIIMSSFERADFSGCRMPGSNLRGAKLAGSNFSGTNLRRSDLSTADFKGATLERVILVEALVMDTIFEDAKLSGANLMLTIMHRAVLRGADVSKANLFCADLTGAVGDNRTSFSGSNVKRALVAGVFHG